MEKLKSILKYTLLSILGGILIFISIITLSFVKEADSFSIKVVLLVVTSLLVYLFFKLINKI